MTTFEALLFGIIQGITEYLPVSSSAHLILLPKFLGTEDPGLAFDVFLHLGTLLATTAYFWRDWWEILVPPVKAIARFGRAMTAGSGSKLAPSPTVSFQALVIATIPALVAGALLHDLAETAFRGNLVQACTLVLGGALLWGVDHFAGRARTLDKLTLKDAAIVGLWQCLALVPGMSRSGSTITGARSLGFDRASAARFSFLISAPVTLAALVFELRKWPELVNGPVGGTQLVVAGIASFAAGVLAIGGLMRMLRRFGYLSFAIYRVILAVVIWQYLGF